MKFLGQGFQKLHPEQDRHIYTQIDATERIITPHLQVVKIWNITRRNSATTKPWKYCFSWSHSGGSRL